MPKKRTTAAEKLVILRGIIVEGKCVWNLKELEKAGTKKGIVTQAIKDVLKNLCDENLVDTDKIGSGAFFWSFSSKARLRAENKIAALEKESEEITAKEGEVHKKLATCAETRGAAVRV